MNDKTMDETLGTVCKNIKKKYCLDRLLTRLQRLLSGLSVKSVIQQPSVRAVILRKDVFIDTRNYWSALHMKVLSDLLGGSLSTEIALTIFLCLKPNTVLLIDSCCFNS